MSQVTDAAVIGTGRMAPGIATAFARAGARVVVLGRSLERARAVARLAGRGVEARSLEPASLRGVELVLETVVEDADVKLDLYARIQPWLERDALLTTNTSGLRISELANGLRHQEAFAGLHFLYPADVTGVVEIIAGDATSPGTIHALRGFAAQMGKAPIVARRDVPGFVWNRLQLALLREALWLLDEGVADIATIDAAVSDGLAARWLASGPFATVDLGGGSTWTRVAAEVFPRLVSSSASETLRKLGERGGTFYEWTDDALAQLTDLRARVLATSREVATERRRVTPPPSAAERA